MHVYDLNFFSNHSSDCERSARKIVPQLVSQLAPSSVLDVGCGDATWLAEFARAGIADYTGVDGPYVHPNFLKIPRERFVGHDLTQPLELGRRYDLVTSLEVAEHLPHEFAAAFVQSLVRHSDLVVFSASIPGQFGEHHVNEQWPGYWVDLFAQNGFRCFDVLRWQWWTDRDISWWYRQNIFVFASAERARLIPILAQHDAAKHAFPLEVAHPDFVALFRNTLSHEASAWQLTKKLLRLARRRTRFFSKG